MKAALSRLKPELEEQFGLVKQAHEMTVALLNEDIAPISIWKACNDLRVKAGYTKTARFYAHGQGYDLIEWHTIGTDETIKIKKWVNFAIHPSVLSERAFAGLGDNYLVNWAGNKERLHSTPRVQQRTPVGRWGKPSDGGKVAVFLASQAADFITASYVRADGGFIQGGITPIKFSE